MADEPRRLVDDQQTGVFKNDFKKFFQAREKMPQSGGGAEKIVWFRQLVRPAVLDYAAPRERKVE
jgi:hypothetical protein